MYEIFRCIHGTGVESWPEYGTLKKLEAHLTSSVLFVCVYAHSTEAFFETKT